MTCIPQRLVAAFGLLLLLPTCSQEQQENRRCSSDCGSSSTSTETPPPSGGSADPCAVDSELTVAAVDVHEGQLANAREIEVRLSREAHVAAVCSAATDPSDVHLVESASAADHHLLRFSGLLGGTEYSCRIAPTCPTMGEDALTIAMSTEDGPSLPTLEVEVDPILGMAGAWTLASFKDGACSRSPNWLAVWDREGVPRWWHRMPDELWIDVEALYHESDATVVWGGGQGQEGRPHVVSLWDGTATTVDLPGWEDQTFHHDGKRLEDGRFLTLELRSNAFEQDDWLGFGLRLYDPVGDRVDLEINSQRYVDEGWLRPAGGGLLDQDPYHANWVERVDHVDGPRVYVSLCFDWSILALDGTTGDVRWKLIDDGTWSVVDAAGNPASFDLLPQCQHGLEVVGDDVLLVYDNGQGRGASQASELAVDPVARQVTVNWVWSEPGWSEATLGDIDDLGDGRVLITEAHPECWSFFADAKSNIVEVDVATGAVASRLTFPSERHTTYRAERYDGCAMFHSVAFCPERAARLDELAPVLGI